MIRNKKIWMSSVAPAAMLIALGLSIDPAYADCTIPNSAGGITCTGPADNITLFNQSVGTQTDITGTTINVEDSWLNAPFQYEQINNSNISISNSTIVLGNNQEVFNTAGISNSTLNFDNVSLPSSGSSGYTFNFYGISTSSYATINLSNSTFDLGNRSLIEIDGEGLQLSLNNIQETESGNVGILASGLNSNVSITNSTLSGSALTDLAAEYNGFSKWTITDSVLSGNNVYGTILYLDTGSSENPNQNLVGTLAISGSTISSSSAQAIQLLAPSTQVDADGNSLHEYVVNIANSKISGAYDTITDGVADFGGVVGKDWILTLNNSSVTAANSGSNAVLLATPVTLSASGTTFDGSISLGTGSDDVTLSSGSTLNGDLSTGDGGGVFSVANSTINGNIIMGGGANSLSTNTAVINGDITGGDDGNDIALADSSLSGGITTGGGQDTITLSGSTSVGGTIDAGDGENSLIFSGDGSSGTITTALDNFSNVIKSGTGTWLVESQLADGSYDGYTTLDLTAEGGNLILAANNSYTGTTQIDNGGGLQLGNGGDTGSVIGDITDNGTLTLDRSDDINFTNLVSGTGKLVKLGSGNTTLVAANSYSGGTDIEGGTLTGNVESFGTGAITDNAALALVQDDDGTLSNAISGTGNVSKSGSGNVILSGVNSYSGGTDIEGGTLTGSSESFGTGAITDNAALALAQDDDGTLSNTISGTGSVSKSGSGNVTLAAANSYTGGTKILAGELSLGNNAALGTGLLTMADGTGLGFAADGLNIANNVSLSGSGDPTIDTGSYTATLSGAITGAGALTKQGSGILVLSGANEYTGATEIAQGTLAAGAVDSFSPASAYTVDQNATMDLAGYDQTVASLVNDGTVSLAGATPGTKLTVSGDYTGDNGLLRIATALGDDNSVTDELVVGGNVSGSTTMQVTNAGGLGAQTTGDGIEVVSVGGTSTADAFKLAGTHVDAGAYQYYLYEGSSSGSGDNWYLRSEVTPTGGETGGGTDTGTGGGTDTGTGTGTDTGTGTGTETGGGTSVPPTVVAYRREVPLYSALPEQLRQADLTMLGNFHQRMGETSSSSMSWMRAIGGNSNIQQGGQANAHSDGYLAGFQAGTDVWRGHGWRIGTYIGYLHGSYDVSGFAGGVNGDVGNNRLNAYFVGAYGTHVWDDGSYLDLVLQGGSTRANLCPTGSSCSGVTSRSGTVSAEIGKPFQLGNTGWAIEPQLQAVHQWLGLDNAYISGDTTVHQSRMGGWLFRAGPRITNEYDTGIGHFSSYIRSNVYYSPSGASLTRFSTPAASTTIRGSGQYSSLELAGGTTLAINKNFNLYGEVGHVWSIGGGTDVKSSIQGSLGIRYKW